MTVRRILLLAAALLSPVMAHAQGMLYQSIAQTVTTIPGSAQGASYVFVPIPSAKIYVCSGTYTGTACNTQTALVYQNQNLTTQITPYVTADVYGNFWFWAAPGTYYYTVVGVVANATVTGTYQLQLPASISGSGVIGATGFNATSGFQIGGTAALNHVLLGNGTYYVDSASIPASIITGLPGSYYQTMKAQGTVQPQESALNFASGLFSLSDSAGSGQTNVNLNITGTGNYVVSALSTALPGTTTTLAQWDGNGNLKTGPSVIGSNGYLQSVTSSWSDQWFTLSSPCAISTSTDSGCTGSITIPSAEPDTNFFVTLTVNATGGAFILADQNGTPTTTSIPYLAACTYNCTNTAYTVSVHVHHN